MSYKTSSLILICVVAILAFWLGAREGSALLPDTDSQVITIGTSILPQMKTPPDIRLLEHFETQRVVTEPLLMRDRHDTPKPRLAESISELPGRIVIKLREDLKFSDGSVISGEDVVWSLTRFLETEVGKQSLLARCLGILGSSEIRIQSVLSVSIGTSGCQPSRLREELASPNYAILKRNSFYGKSADELWHEPVSGMYLMRRRGEEILFEPNVHHYLYQAQQPPPRLRFVYVAARSVGPFELPGSQIDILKTLDPSVIAAAEEAGFHRAMSPPVMTWYLSSDHRLSPEERLPVDRLVRWARLASDFQLPFFDGNPVETAGQSMFPLDFNCDRTPAKDGEHRALPSDGVSAITLVGHASGESEPFLGQIQSEFARLGIDSEVEPWAVTTGAQKSEGPQAVSRVLVRRQFLGPDFMTTFQLLFHTFKALSDLTGEMRLLLGQFEAVSKASQDSVLQKMCATLADAPFIPLAHRKVAWVAREVQFLDLASTASGYYSFATATGWGD